MPAKDELLLSYYGDDFTGSTDALEFLTRAGIRTALFVEPPTPERLARYPGLRAVGVAGMTRSMAPDAMEKVLDPALQALKALGAPHVHYKVCSTFDSSATVGSIGRVIDLAAKIFDAPFVPLLVGAPELGRHCVFGNLFARFGGEGEIFRLDRHPSMSRHPVTPADESDLRKHLARQTAKRIGLFDILQVDLPQAKAKAALEEIIAKRAEIVLFDVLYARQLEQIGALLDQYASRERPLLSVGSSGIEAALSAHWAAEGWVKKIEHWPDPDPAQPLLVASGSRSPITEKQIAWALANDFTEVVLDAAFLAAGHTISEAGDTLAAHLKAGRNVIAHTGNGEGWQPDKHVPQDKEATKVAVAKLLGSLLGRVVREAVEKTGVRRLCVAGGDTSGHVARALGIESMEMICPIAPGAPLCRAQTPGLGAGTLEVVFKGGQVGNADFFGTVQKGKP